MIRKVKIQNFKSIPDLTLELGRITVLIGANGSGKSNILEAIATASAAAQDKLDNEFLVSRGIRVTDTRFMRSAFGEVPPREFGYVELGEAKMPAVRTVLGKGFGIGIRVEGDEGVAFDRELLADEEASRPKWQPMPSLRPDEFAAALEDLGPALGGQSLPDIRRRVIARLIERSDSRPAGTLPGFLVYSPENSALRTFQAEGQILPLGIKGEGLFAHLKALNSPTRKDRLEKIREKLALIDWFDTFVIPENLGPGERTLGIHDRYLPEGALFDQRSASEGFLFLLFYVTLFVSPETPAFFSIDNIDSSLNPKLCTALLQQIAALAKEYDKQAILTTHNPAVLDGLDLNDPEQRLMVVDRNKEGHTYVRCVEPPKIVAGQIPVSLSEAFMRGYIGGLPKNF